MPRISSLPARIPSLQQTRATITPDRYGQGRGGRPWRRLVEAVKLRDQFTCQKCGRITTDGDCDHIVPTSEGGTDDMSNLQWLCRTPCHEEKTKAEAARGQGSARGVTEGRPISRGGETES